MWMELAIFCNQHSWPGLFIEWAWDPGPFKLCPTSNPQTTKGQRERSPIVQREFIEWAKWHQEQGQFWKRRRCKWRIVGGEKGWWNGNYWNPKIGAAKIHNSTATKLSNCTAYVSILFVIFIIPLYRETKSMMVQHDRYDKSNLAPSASPPFDV